MQQQRFMWQLSLALVVVSLVSIALLRASSGQGSGASDITETSSYIVQSASAEDAKRLVVEAGGTVTAMLAIIDAVGADLTDTQVVWLRAHSAGIRVHKDASLNVSGSVSETDYPSLVGASSLHEQGIKGKGITIAVLDTGLWKTRATQYTAGLQQRILAQHDVLARRNFDDDFDDDDFDDDDDEDEDHDDDFDDHYNGGFNRELLDRDIDDWNGHGTHVTSIMMSSDRTESGRYQGVAPSANVVAVKAFDADGSGSYLNVILALDWIVSHRREYKIRILNLSFGAPAASHYWDDPVNQAVMAAWQSGIIVVAAAGNSGPGPMTVGVPGNVPYVITVGAITDNYTPEDNSDDRLASFSSAGPTVEGFVKPEIVAPGGHMLGQMPAYAWLALEHPDFVESDGDYFRMSGTSQSAAVVSGVLALMLENDPALSPNDAKCRIMASAKTAFRGNGQVAYSVFQQGAGMIDAVAAVNDRSTNCANRGMHIFLEFWLGRHYAGPAGVDDDGTYYLVDENNTRLSGSEFEWQQGSLWLGGALWPEGVLSSYGALWNTGVPWNNASSLNPDSLLINGALWPEGSLWPEGLTRPVSTYSWVTAE